MSRVQVALLACLIVGCVLQFIFLPGLRLKRGVHPHWWWLYERAANLSEVMLDASKIGRNNVTVQKKETPEPFRQLAECPEFGIPHLNRMNVLDLDELMSMDEAETRVFGRETLQVVRQATAQAHSVIPRIIPKEEWFKTSARRRFEANLSQLQKSVGNYTFTPGGHWKPKYCVPRWKVAIIIPFRNRSHQLPIILRYLVPMLQRQRLEFGIFTINQENGLLFNRAMLMNIGFGESLNFSHWDCFVFHDVDHVPLSDYNYYGCTNFPRHFVTGTSNWNYTLLYKAFFGAVTGFTKSNIWKMNGFPNVYWGWGGEDDDILVRVQEAHLTVGRRPRGSNRFIGFYKVIEHHHHSAPIIQERYDLLRNASSRMSYDGLSNLKYPPPRLEIHPLYVNISVDIFKLDLESDPK